MTTCSPEDLFDDVDEVVSGSQGIAGTAPAGNVEPKPVVTEEQTEPPKKRGRPVGGGVKKPILDKPKKQQAGRPAFKVTAEKGEGLFSCGNCLHFKTPWKNNSKTGQRVNCEAMGVAADSKPCSFSKANPLNKFSPLAVGQVALAPSMSFPEMQILRVLLNRREDEIALEASCPFRVGDKVTFIHQHQPVTGTVDGLKTNHVNVRVIDKTTNEVKIYPLQSGSVIKVQ